MLYERNRHIKWFVVCWRRDCPAYCCGIFHALDFCLTVHPNRLSLEFVM